MQLCTEKKEPPPLLFMAIHYMDFRTISETDGHHAALQSNAIKLFIYNDHWIILLAFSVITPQQDVTKALNK